MLLERTISQLDVGYVPNQIAEELGHPGYAQWLGALKGEAAHLNEALRPYEFARSFIRTCSAVAIFRQLLIDSTTSPLKALELKLPANARRGGSKARRDAL